MARRSLTAPLPQSSKPQSFFARLAQFYREDWHPTAYKPRPAQTRTALSAAIAAIPQL